METNYDAEARDDAQRMVEHVIDDVLEALKSGDEADKYYHEYSGCDDYHFENHTDREYSLLEAAELLGQLRRDLETDGGMWEGQEPQQAVCTQAAYTYSNAVARYFREMVEAVNADAEGGILHDMLNEKVTDEDGDEELVLSDEVMNARIMEVCEDF